MRNFFKYLLLIGICISAGAILSYFAFYGFWFGAILFHSVPIMRACDAAGSVVLGPARLFYFCFGNMTDQSTPLSDPIRYSLINGILLGLFFYSCIRHTLFGKRCFIQQ